jgi:hypothetical protein
MRNRLAAVLNGLLVAAMFAIAFLVIYKRPPGPQVAIHWGPDTRPDAWVGGSAIQLINPIIALVIWFSALIHPKAFVLRATPIKTAQVRISNILLIQLVIQLLMALYLN